MKWNKIQDKLLKVFQNKNRVLYSALLKKITKGIKDEDKNINNTVGNAISTLSKQQKSLVDDVLITSYLLINKDKKEARKILKQKWNNKHYSERLHKDKLKLKRTLIKEISKGIKNEDNNAEIIKRVSKRLDISLNNAKRLVDTEMTAVINIAEANRGLKEGKTKYRYIATIDDRTSGICKELHNKVFNLSDLKVGVNCAPLHPYCRSRIEVI